MIQPDYIDVREQSSQTVNAPAITRAAKRLPVVNGIAPKLSIRGEVVGRNAGDKSRTPPFGQEEEFGVRPDIAGIG